MSVDGTDAGMFAPALINLSLTGFSVEEWVRTLAPATSTTPIAKATQGGADDPTPIWEINVAADGTVQALASKVKNNGSTGNAYVTPSSAVVDDGEWHHVVVAFAGSSTAIYVDGQSVAGATSIQSGTGVTGIYATCTPPNQCTKMSDLEFGPGFSGSLDEPAIYSGDLSAAQTLAHYQAGVALATDGSGGGSTGDTQTNPDYTPPDGAGDPDPSSPAPPTVSGWDGASQNVIPCCEGGVTIDRAAIVAYAKKYVGTLGTDLNTGWNPAYPSYGNDCQNFVSQALHAGGWPFDTAAGGPWYVPDVWAYFDSVDHSWSWTVSSYFWRYVGEYATNRATFVSYWSQLQPGDVVFVDWYGQNNYPTHTMLVTSRTTDPNTGQIDLGLTYHTTNRLNESLRTLIGLFPNAKWWAIHLSDSF